MLAGNCNFVYSLWMQSRSPEVIKITEVEKPLDAGRIPLDPSEVVVCPAVIPENDLLAIAKATSDAIKCRSRLPFIDVMNSSENKVFKLDIPGLFDHTDDRFNPLKTAVQSLLNFSGLEPYDNQAIIMRDGKGAYREWHQDKADATRSLLTIEGNKHIQFKHSESPEITYINIGPGDTYRMRFTNGQDSPWHEADYQDGATTLYVETYF